MLIALICMLGYATTGTGFSWMCFTDWRTGRFNTWSMALLCIAVLLLVVAAAHAIVLLEVSQLN